MNRILFCLAAFLCSIANVMAGNSIGPGQQLFNGESISSPNGQYTMVFQHDGNLVTYGPNGPVWWSDTTGRGGVRVSMQLDGNFVMYAHGNQVVWSSHTIYGGEKHLELGNDGRIRIFLWRAVWSTQTFVQQWPASPNAAMMPGTVLRPDDQLALESGAFKLVMQSDGNLVLYRYPGGVAVWHSQTHGNPGAYARMQPDGNFVVYSHDARPLWSTQTQHAGAWLYLQANGDLVLRQPLFVWENGSFASNGGTVVGCPNWSHCGPPLNARPIYTIPF